jgi:hypothetical protein
VGPEGRTTNASALSAASQTVLQSDLDISVGFADGSASVPLVETLPLRTGNDIQVRWAAPAGHHAALFWLDTEGKLSNPEAKLLPDTAAGANRLIFPGPGEAETLIGAPGTEVCLVVASKDRPPTLDDLEGLLADGPWPVLPNDTALHFDSQRTDIERLGATRALSGRSRRRADDVEERAAKLRAELAKRFDAFAGVAFPHAPDEAAQ